MDTFEKNQAALAKSSEEQAKTLKAAKQVAAEGVDARIAVKDKQVKEYYERQEGLQPTPTQRENDLARVGALDIDDKEDDGSEWQDEHDKRVATEKVSNPYVAADESEETKAVRAKKKRK